MGVDFLAPTVLAIDTDPGIDDAATIAVAARSPEIDLRLLTTVAGNVDVVRASTNALRILDRLGRHDVPVAQGAARGLVRRKPSHRAIHGEDGLGGVMLPASTRPIDRRSAVTALAELVAGEPPRSVTVLAIAPLTNFATFLAVRPDLAGRIGRVVVMGGSDAAGNITPHAEYNTWADPEAAARVFEGGELEVHLVPLGVTRQATLDTRSASALRGGSPFGRELSRMMEGYEDAAPMSERALHDLVTITTVIDPAVVRWRSATVTVETGSGPRRGATRLDFGTSAAASPVQIAVDVDVARMRDLLVDRLAHI